MAEDKKTNSEESQKGLEHLISFIDKRRKQAQRKDLAKDSRRQAAIRAYRNQIKMGP